MGQVQPEGGTPGMLWSVSELAGAEKASHANCAVVSQRALAAAVPGGGNAWPSGRRAKKLQWRNERARIMLHLFVYVMIIATWLAVSVLFVLDSLGSQSERDPIALGWPDPQARGPLRQSVKILQLPIAIQY